MNPVKIWAAAQDIDNVLYFLFLRDDKRGGGVGGMSGTATMPYLYLPMLVNDGASHWHTLPYK